MSRVASECPQTLFLDWIWFSKRADGIEKYSRVDTHQEGHPLSCLLLHVFQGVLFKLGITWGHQIGSTRRLYVALPQLGSVHWIGHWNFQFFSS